MADVTNPGLVNVVDEVDGNPDPNGGTARSVARTTAALTSVADDGHSLPPDGGVDASVFPTPAEVDVGDESPSPQVPVSSVPVPAAAEVEVDAQSIGQGGMRPVDPGNPAAGYEFASPAEFVVVGPATSFQTNRTEADSVTAAVSAVYDADNLFNPPGPSTSRYYLTIATPPTLTSYPVSLLGRQVIFGDFSANPGAARNITNYGGNFIVINREDTSESNGDVDELVTPVPGDTFQLDVQRYGSEQVNTPGRIADVTIGATPPGVDVVQAPFMGSGGTFDVSTGPQPAPPSPQASTRTPAPSPNTVQVADQSAVVGLPGNAYA